MNANKYKFKYFMNPEANAEFTEENCQFCGTKEKCLEGEYFDREDEVTSVCLDCLVKGETTVQIPQYLKDRLYTHLKNTFKEKSSEELKELFESTISELEKNPPVPWIQYNDWPVCDGDFMRYVGEWKQEDFNNVSQNGNGKDYILSILDDFTKSRIDDIDVFWNDIGNYTAVFVFMCIHCNKIIGVAQSY